MIYLFLPIKNDDCPKQIWLVVEPTPEKYEWKSVIKWYKVMIVDNFNWIYNMIDNIIISHLSLVDGFTRSFSHSTVETRIAQAATALRQVSFLQISSSLVVAKPWTKSGPDQRPESSTFRCTMSASYVVRVKHSRTKSVPKCPDCPECC
jgi:hypothetical protein